MKLSLKQISLKLSHKALGFMKKVLQDNFSPLDSSKVEDVRKRNCLERRKGKTSQKKKMSVLAFVGLMLSTNC